MHRNLYKETFRIHKHTHTDMSVQWSLLVLGHVSVWVLLASHSPWRPDVQLDQTVLQ